MSKRTELTRRCELPDHFVFATIYKGGSPLHYFKALLYLGFSLIHTDSICSLRDLLVIAVNLGIQERDCLTGLGFQVINAAYHWPDVTRVQPRRWECFLKITLFRLYKFKKIVYLDSDGLATSDLKPMFGFPSISAVHSAPSMMRKGMEHYNVGVMVIKPSARLHNKIMASWVSGNYSALWHKDLTDQELILHCCQDEFFDLPVTYNCKTAKSITTQHKICAFLHIKWWIIGHRSRYGRMAVIYREIREHFNFIASLVANASAFKMCVSLQLAPLLVS